MPRPKLDKHRLQVMIDNDLMDYYTILLVNPATGRMKYGALSTIVNALLRRLLERLREPNADVTAIMRAFGIDMTEIDMEENEEEEV